MASLYLTVCNLNNVGGVSPNGVYSFSPASDDSVAWERIVGDVTFSLRYFEALPTKEWHIIDTANPGTWLAIGGAAANEDPWESTWVDNGGYGIAIVTDGDAGCPTPTSTCDPSFDWLDNGDECGADRFRRLRLLGYI